MDATNFISNHCITGQQASGYSKLLKDIMSAQYDLDLTNRLIGLATKEFARFQ